MICQRCAGWESLVDAERIRKACWYYSMQVKSPVPEPGTVQCLCQVFLQSFSLLNLLLSFGHCYWLCIQMWIYSVRFSHLFEKLSWALLVPTIAIFKLVRGLCNEMVMSGNLFEEWGLQECFLSCVCFLFFPFLLTFSSFRDWMVKVAVGVPQVLRAFQCLFDWCVGVFTEMKVW